MMAVASMVDAVDNRRRRRRVAAVVAIVVAVAVRARVCASQSYNLRGGYRATQNKDSRLAHVRTRSHGHEIEPSACANYFESKAAREQIDRLQPASSATSDEQAGRPNDVKKHAPLYAKQNKRAAAPAPDKKLQRKVASRHSTSSGAHTNDERRRERRRERRARAQISLSSKTAQIVYSCARHTSDFFAARTHAVDEN